MAEPKERDGDAPAPTPPPTTGEADLATLFQDWFRHARGETQRRERERRHPPSTSQSQGAG